MNTTIFVDILCDGYPLSLLAVMMGHLDWCQMGKNFGTRHDGSRVTSFRNEAAVCLICYLHHTPTHRERGQFSHDDEDDDGLTKDDFNEF